MLYALTCLCKECDINRPTPKNRILLSKFRIEVDENCQARHIRSGKANCLSDFYSSFARFIFQLDAIFIFRQFLSLSKPGGFYASSVTSIFSVTDTYRSRRYEGNITCTYIHLSQISRLTRKHYDDLMRAQFKLPAMYYQTLTTLVNAFILG
jgi:hypothetical protein